MKKIIFGMILILLCIGIYFFVEFVRKNENNYSSEKFKDVIINSPKANSKIQSPFMIRGKARGMWFFEASFPIILTDDKGKEIAITQARAEAEWMTEGYVPFSAELVFSGQNSGTHGVLVFKRDNPSSLPENDASVSIPVVF